MDLFTAVLGGRKEFEFVTFCLLQILRSISAVLEGTNTPCVPGV